MTELNGVTSKEVKDVVEKIGKDLSTMEKLKYKLSIWPGRVRVHVHPNLLNEFMKEVELYVQRDENFQPTGYFIYGHELVRDESVVENSYWIEGE